MAKTKYKLNKVRFTRFILMVLLVVTICGRITLNFTRKANATSTSSYKTMSAVLVTNSFQLHPDYFIVPAGQFNIGDNLKIEMGGYTVSFKVTEHNQSEDITEIYHFNPEGTYNEMKREYTVIHVNP